MSILSSISRTRKSLRFFAVLLSMLVMAEQTVHAQPGGRTSYPNSDYYAALQLYREGRLADATRGFESALGRGRVDINGKWIDSIPANTMLGECYYQLGDIRRAQQYFDSALRLMLQHDGWMQRVQWPQTVTQAGGTPAMPNWVAGLNRPIRPGGVPRTLTLSVGQYDVTAAIQSGTGFQPPQLLPVDVAEILRCLGWTLYRRSDLLGVFAIDDPLVEQLSARLRAIQLPADAWPNVWIQLLDGLALLADGQMQQAIPRLQQSSLLPGGLDHPLTPLAGLALGRVMHESGNRAVPADRLLNEALVGAIVQDQYEIVNEAFRISTGHAAASSGTGLYQQAIGLAASQGRRERFIGAAAMLAAAEIAAANGNVDEATARLKDFATLLSRRGFDQPRMQAQADYVNALCAAQRGDLSTAAGSIDAMTKFARAGQFGIGSARVYQLGLLETALSSGNIGNRRGEELMSQLLGPPSALAWRRSAIDAIAAQSIDVTNFYQTQLGRSWNQLKPEQLVDQVDRLLRERFRRSVSVGGRAVDLRWLVSAPEGWLSESAKEQKQNPSPALKNFLGAGQSLSGLAAQRAALPIRPGPDDVKNVDQVEKGLWNAADMMERMALTHALRRQPVAEVFPPPLQQEDLAKHADAGIAVLAYCGTPGGIKGIWIHDGKVDTWDVGNATSIEQSIATLLKQIGVGPSQGATPRLPKEQTWRESAASMVGTIAPPLSDGRVDGVQRLVVVPYGPMWMMPFELLPVSGPGQRIVAERMETTYAPTIGLAFHPVPLLSTATSTAGLTNRFFHPADGEKENAARDLLDAVVDDSLLLAGGNAMVGRRVKALTRSLWIANVNTPSPGDVFSFSPLYYDRSRGGGLLSDWMRMPLTAPAMVLLPGTDFTSGDSFSVAGDVMFLTSCALHASGVRHVVLSRWPVRGESTRQLLAETLKEAAVTDTLSAWQRALLLLRSSELLPEDEPLLTAGDETRWDLTGAEPLFWAGYVSLRGLQQP